MIIIYKLYKCHSCGAHIPNFGWYRIGVPIKTCECGAVNNITSFQNEWESMGFIEKTKVLITRLSLDLTIVFIVALLVTCSLIPLLDIEALSNGKTVLLVALAETIAVLIFLHIRAVSKSRERTNSSKKDLQ